MLTHAQMHFLLRYCIIRSSLAFLTDFGTESWLKLSPAKYSRQSSLFIFLRPVTDNEGKAGKKMTDLTLPDFVYAQYVHTYVYAQ